MKDAKELVFVHGRSQQKRDSTELKRQWLEAFAKGLHKSGLRLPISEESVRFPYYGDALFDLVRGVKLGSGSQIVVRGEDPDEQEFERQIREEIRAEMERLLRADTDVRSGDRGVLNQPWIRSVLAQIDGRVPGGSAASIALFARDVYRYINNRDIQDQIDEGMCKAMNDKPAVVVGHSLGSVIAYDLLSRHREDRRWNVPLFVTLGSPLAVKAIRDRLVPVNRPSCVERWFNAMDRRDIVALHPLNAAHGWDIIPSIENKTDVDNPTPNRHGISGYLENSVVARRLYEALQGREH